MIKHISKVGKGDKVKDKISGFTGIVNCVAFWINGCIRCCVVEQKIKDGKINEQWVDEPQLKILKKKAVDLGIKEPTHGPKNDYIRNNH